MTMMTLSELGHCSGIMRPGHTATNHGDGSHIAVTTAGPGCAPQHLQGQAQQHNSLRTTVLGPSALRTRTDCQDASGPGHMGMTRTHWDDAFRTRTRCHPQDEDNWPRQPQEQDTPGAGHTDRRRSGSVHVAVALSGPEHKVLAPSGPRRGAMLPSGSGHEAMAPSDTGHNATAPSGRRHTGMTPGGQVTEQCDPRDKDKLPQHPQDQVTQP